LPDAFVVDFPALRLRAFKGMRNLVARQYQRVDYEIVWETIAVDVPRLDAQAAEILRRVERPAEPGGPSGAGRAAFSLGR
jgi:uncharacterized protein with HEPN domain